MVGQTFAMDSKYFGEIGAFDEGMSIWGGENLELAWRVRIINIINYMYNMRGSRKFFSGGGGGGGSNFYNVFFS